MCFAHQHISYPFTDATIPVFQAGLFFLIANAWKVVAKFYVTEIAAKWFQGDLIICSGTVDLSGGKTLSSS